MVVPHRLVLREGELRYISKPLRHLCVKLLPWNPGESKEHFCIFLLSLWSIYSQHTFSRGVWDFGGQLFLSLSLFFFMISNLQKSCRNSTGYFYYTPYLNPPIIYIFLHLFYYSMNWFICVYHILCSVTQWHPTLCDPMDCTWPGSSVHEDSPDKNTGMGCHALLYHIYTYILFVFWNTASKLDIVPNYSLNQHVFTENKVLFSYAIEWLSKLGSLTHTVTIYSIFPYLNFIKRPSNVSW